MLSCRSTRSAAAATCGGGGGSLKFKVKHAMTMESKLRSTFYRKIRILSTNLGAWDRCCKIVIVLLFKMSHPRPLFVYFRLFKQTSQFLKQINVKNVHSVYGSEIRTHDIRDRSLLHNH